MNGASSGSLTPIQGTITQGSIAVENGMMPSAAVQLVLKLRNPNHLENSLLELCKVTVFLFILESHIRLQMIWIENKIEALPLFLSFFGFKELAATFSQTQCCEEGFCRFKPAF